MNKPTIGRIVQFKPAALDGECLTNGAEVLPAVIVRVWSEHEDATVNLKVLTDGPQDQWRTSVPKNGNTIDQGEYTWDWPARV